MSTDSRDSVAFFLDELRRGDRTAAHELWHRFCPRLLALARKIGRASCRMPRGHDPEDAVQSAFISFWQRAERGDIAGEMDRDQLWSLLGLITVRKALKHLERERAQKRGGGQVVSEQALSPQGGEPFTFDQLAGSVAAPEFDLICEDLLGLLEDPLREIALYRMLGYKNSEIAGMLSCTERKVERKLQLIRAIWEQEISPEG